MLLRPVATEELNRLFKPTKLLRELDAFIRSDMPAAELEFAPGEYKSIKSAYGAYHAAAARYKLPVKVRNIGGKVFLIRIGSEPTKESEDED